MACEKIHPIILNNKQNRRHWFDIAGNYIETFDGLDGKEYVAIVQPSEWPPEIWALYEKEGITVNKPTPVENIEFPKKSSE